MEELLPRDEQQRSSVPRSACTECQRRKQKCNREWPCNQCQKRKVANNCRFMSVLDERSSGVDPKRPTARPPPAAPVQPSTHGHFDHFADYHEEDEDEDEGEDIMAANLQVLGYSAAHFLSDANPSIERKPKSGVKQYIRRQADCPHLDHALQVLPPRPYSDALVQHFLNVVNFHYYIIHPQSFVAEYEQWWSDRIQDRPLSLPWTSLLLMICACSAQFPDADSREWLERDLGQAMPKLSEKYHTAGRELYNAIPVGHSHLFTVQQLLHSCYWFKSEARYVDCWHTLTTAIREAQELGIHQESIVPVATDFEQEIRRRVWCILSNWDWKVGALLSRPLILDPTECDVQLPNLSLEDYVPSPVLATKLQTELIWTLSRRFGRPANVTAAIAVEEYKAIVESWAARFPQPFTFDDPDRRMDAVCPWIPLHRYYLHTMAFSTALDPIRPFLARPICSDSPQIEHAIRADGICYSLKLMNTLIDFFNFGYSQNRKFHSVLFHIFNVAALLYSAILHDKDQCLPSRQECLRAAEMSRNLLGQILPEIPTARKPYEILSRLAKKMESAMQGQSDDHARKRSRVAGASMTGPAVLPPSVAGPLLYTMNPETMPAYAAHANEPPSEPWIILAPEMHSASSQHQQSDLSMFGPSPPCGVSCVNSSFILSTSPNGEMDGAPILRTMASGHRHDIGTVSTADQHYQDFSFANLTESEFGNMASIWDYSHLNLDFAVPYSGN